MQLESSFSINACSGLHDQIIATYRRQLQSDATMNAQFEAMKVKVNEAQQRMYNIEDSIRQRRDDFERQIEQQNRDQAGLQAELENMKRVNVEVNQQANIINSDILDAKNTNNEKELEI